MAADAALRGEFRPAPLSTASLVALNVAERVTCGDPHANTAVVDRVAKAAALTREHWGVLSDLSKAVILFHMFAVVPETRAATGLGPVGLAFDEALLIACERHSMREVDDEFFVRNVRDIYRTERVIVSGATDDATGAAL